MCPSNPLGTVDLLVGSHHSQAISNSEVLVHAIEPRVVLMNNGIRKGGQPEAMKVFYSAPGVEDIWQLHFSQLSGQEYRPGSVHRKPRGRSAGRHADCPDDASRSWSGRATAGAGASSQRPGLLAQGLCPGRWIVYGDERAERVQQVLRGARPSVSQPVASEHEGRS